MITTTSAQTDVSISNQSVTSYNPAAPKYQQKTFWFPGGICSVLRTHSMPDLMTVVTTMPEHLKSSTVNMCISKLSDIKFENRFPELEVVSVDTLRDARTGNMTCAVIGQAQTPMMYQIRFSDFALTGKDQEIEECITKAVNSPEKAPLRHLPNREVSL